ncbi:MAG: ribulose-phosphate 3-epimerase [Acutalibacteraceae bacterium]
MKIAPSMLSCDFSVMKEELERIDRSGADWVHLDVMDGHFVPNLTIGPSVIQAIRPYTKIPFDVHLMITNPIDYVEPFAKAGSDILTFHIESASDPKATIEKIKASGMKAGLSVKPNTPIETIYPYLDDLYLVLVMTVEPGFGGQKFMADMMPKVTALRAEAKRRDLDIIIEIDGGVSAENIRTAAEAGVDVCVAGTSVFKAENAAQAIAEMKQLCE